MQQGKAPEALVAYRHLIGLGEATAVDLGNVASLCNQMSAFVEAEALARQALVANDNYPNAHNLLANALIGQGRLREALPCLTQAIALKPDNPAYHFNLANLLQQQGELQAAVESYRQALAINPDHVESLNNLANAWIGLGDLTAAIHCYNRILACTPGDPQISSNLGLALAIQGDLRAGVDEIEQALRLNPGFPGALNNLGLVSEMQGDMVRAEACYRRAIQVGTDHPQHADVVAGAQKNLGMAELLRGEYASGWQRYAYRFAAENHRSILHAKPICPPLEPQALRPGTPLLLVSEQGLGDCLQFMRYALAFRQLGVAVRLCLPSKLHGLSRLSQLDPEPLTPEQANRVSHGYWLPMLSAAQVLSVSPANPIVRGAYLRSSAELVAKWRQRLAQEPRPLIGIHWQGNPEHERSTSRGRSLPLEHFGVVAQRTQGRLLSLQKGFGMEQRHSCSFQDHFVSCQALVDQCWDFVETAAIIANCDIVISSDSCLAHLSAGMGHPTWLLLKSLPEWRWGLDGDRSFWYPSMRLFRQRYDGNWSELMQRVADALAAAY